MLKFMDCRINTYKLILLALLFSSCKGSTVHNDVAENTDSIPDSAQVNATEPDPLLVCDSTTFSLPTSISNTNIEDYFDETQDQPLTASQAEKLQLNTLEECNGCDLYLLGQLHFSDSFKTRLVFRNAGWNEWKMWLVNYDPENKILDALLILYGDNVEYLSETFSNLTTEKIDVTVVDYTYTSEEEDSTAVTKTYLIRENGTFQPE